MQRKKAFLICAMAALMSMNHANAESLEDAGKFEIRSAAGDFRIAIGGLMTQTLDVEYRKNVKDDQNAWGLNFNLDRARLRLYGSAFDPALTYLLQLQFEKDREDLERALVNVPPGKGSVHLLDASISWALNREWLHLATGKFAVPGSRQQVIAAAKTQFLKSSKLLRQFDATEPYNRDVGFLVHNAYDNPLEYAVALVSNGIAARLGYNYGPLDGYNAVDFVGGDLRFGVGASGFFKSDYMKNIGDRMVASADYMVKIKHFASNGAFYLERVNKENSFGAGLDAGYLINQKWEPIVRYAWAKPGEHHHEIMAGLNHYFYGHNVKAELYLGTEIYGSDMKNVLGGVGLQLSL